MDNKTIFSKTAKGLREASGASSNLPRALRSILKEIDGKRMFSDLQSILHKHSATELRELLERLENDGYVRDTGRLTQKAETQSPSSVMGQEAGGGLADLDFTSLSALPASPPRPRSATNEDVLRKIQEAKQAAEAKTRQLAEAKAKREAEQQVKLAALAKAKREAEEIARQEALAKAKCEAEEKARHEAEERARKEAQEQARIEAEARAKREAEDRERREAEERARREAEAQARREVEEKARYEAEELARKEAEEQARIEAEARAKQEAEERARREAEEQVRREAEAQARREAEEKARFEAEERARKAAEEQARIEAETRAKREAEEQERREAEQRIRLEAEAQARREVEEKARYEAEELARKEAEEQARIEVEARVKQEAEERARREAEEQVRREAEAQARREAEEKARFEAEERARKAAEEQARIEAEARARRETEEQERREAEALARREAEAQARREMEAQAKQAEEERERLAAWELSKRKAEEKLRLEAEAKARQEAEDRIRIEAKERAEREAEAQLKEALKEQARLEAEEKARQEKETRIRREAEEELRREAKQKAKQEAREQAERETAEKAALAAERATSRGRIKWGKLTALVVLPLIAIFLGLIHFISFDGRIPDLEKAASEQFQLPVKIDSLHFSLFPQPHWRLEGVTVGDQGEIKSPQVNAIIDLARFGAYKSLVFDSPLLKDQAAGWLLFGKPQGQSLNFSAIRANNIGIESQSVNLPRFDAKADIGADGNWQKIVLEFRDGNVYVELHPGVDQVAFEITATSFTLPLGGSIQLDDFTAKGSFGRREMKIAQFEGRNFGGSFLGDARLTWADSWSLDGGVSVKQLDTKKLAPALLSGGRIDGKAVYTLQGTDTKTLFARPHVEGRFTVSQGEVLGVDLMHLLQNAANSGKTGFRETSGTFVHDGDVTQLRQLRMDAGIFSVSGSAELEAGGVIRGRFATSYRFDNIQKHGTLSLSGTLSEPKFGR